MGVDRYLNLTQPLPPTRSPHNYARYSSGPTKTRTISTRPSTTTAAAAAQEPIFPIRLRTSSAANPAAEHQPDAAYWPEGDFGKGGDCVWPAAATRGSQNPRALIQQHLLLAPHVEEDEALT